MDRTGASVVLPILFMLKNGETLERNVGRLLPKGSQVGDLFLAKGLGFYHEMLRWLQEKSLNWVRMFQQKTKNKTRRRSWSLFHKINRNIRVEKSLTVDMIWPTGSAYYSRSIAELQFCFGSSQLQMYGCQIEQTIRIRQNNPFYF